MLLRTVAKAQKPDFLRTISPTRLGQSHYQKGNKFAETSEYIGFDFILLMNWTDIEEDTLWNIGFECLEALGTVSYYFSVLGQEVNSEDYGFKDRVPIGTETTLKQSLGQV